MTHLSARDLQGCKYIDEVRQEFCCYEGVSQCEYEEEWFIEDELAKIEAFESSQKAVDDAALINAIIQWMSIVLCAICCPLCIGMAICKCLRKEREREEKEKFR